MHRVTREKNMNDVNVRDLRVEEEKVVVFPHSAEWHSIIFTKSEKQ